MGVLASNLVRYDKDFPTSGRLSDNFSTAQISWGIVTHAPTRPRHPGPLTRGWCVVDAEVRVVWLLGAVQHTAGSAWLQCDDRSHGWRGWCGGEPSVGRCWSAVDRSAAVCRHHRRSTLCRRRHRTSVRSHWTELNWILSVNSVHSCRFVGIYRAGQKSKLLHFVHIFAKCWSIFTIFFHQLTL